MCSLFYNTAKPQENSSKLMEEQCSPLSWSYNYYQEEGFEELKHSLVYSTLELEAAVLSAHEELSRKDEEILHLKDLLAKIIKERDEFQEKCRVLVFEKELILKQVKTQAEYSSKQHKECAVSSGTTSNEDDENIELLPSDSDENIVVQSDSLQQQQPPLPRPLDKISFQKPLPENGKFLQAVMEAGPLLQTLLLAGPLPQWQHPPPQLNSIDIPLVTISSPKPRILPQDSCVFGPTSSGGFSHKRAMANVSDFTPNSKCQKLVHQSSLIMHLVSP